MRPAPSEHRPWSQPVMWLLLDVCTAAALFLLVFGPCLSAKAQGTTGPIIRDSNVGYIDAAIPGNIIRLQYDAAFDNRNPTRSEFFWSPGPPFGEGPSPSDRSVDYQDFAVGLEHVFAPQTSAFVTVPVRLLDPELNSNTAGVADVSAGVKHAFIYRDDLVAAFQLRAFAPTGDASHGNGNGHTSLEPALLVYKPLGDGWVAEFELRDWIPIGGGDFAGNVLRYGTGLHYDGICWNDCQVVPVAEVVGWTALDGRVTTVDANGVATIDDASGDTIVNFKVGVRLAFSNDSDVYIGYGRPLTGDSWYEDTFRIEFRFYQ